MSELGKDSSSRYRTSRAELWDEDEIDSGKGLALLSYLPGLCFIGLLQGPENRFIYHHARQGFLLFLIEIAALLFRWNLVWDALLVICAGLALFGMINAFSGRSFHIPILSDWFGGLRG